MIQMSPCKLYGLVSKKLPGYTELWFFRVLSKSASTPCRPKRVWLINNLDHWCPTYRGTSVSMVDFCLWNGWPEILQSHTMQEDTLYLPDHSKYGGLNDRFAMARPEVAKLYGERRDYTLSKCKEIPVHAERYVSELVKDHKLNLVEMQRFDFFRVRATGEIAQADMIAMLGCHPDTLEKLPINVKFKDLVVTARTQLRARARARFARRSREH